MVLQLIGKYDTYKGSTLSLTWNKVFRYELGNMILIKDRHPCTTGYEIAQSGTWGNMILIKDYVFGVICF